MSRKFSIEKHIVTSSSLPDAMKYTNTHVIVKLYERFGEDQRVIDWCYDNDDMDYYIWQLMEKDMVGHKIVYITYFLFKRQEDAMIFKLKFGEVSE